MNKTEFLKVLSEKTGLDEGKCKQINEIVEGTFLIGRNNKEKMLEKFISTLNIDKSEADKIYNTVMGIVGNELKNKIKNPFKSQD
ncbi:MAG: hypothetical protein IJ629_04920 [Clostridia bacterium]|nr:hypothetical protein [Clostridia bacterium]